MKGRKNAPLIVTVDGDCLVIRIGINTLAQAAEECPKFYDDEKHSDGPPYCKVTDNLELAKDIKRELEREEEDGSSPLSDLLDECIEAARGDGSLAFQDESEVPS